MLAVISWGRLKILLLIICGGIVRLLIVTPWLLWPIAWWIIVGAIVRWIIRTRIVLLVGVAII